MMEPQRGAVALNEDGEPGMITANHTVWAASQPAGGWVWCGFHLSKEKAGNRWESKNPKILFSEIQMEERPNNFTPEPEPMPFGPDRDHD